MSNVEGNAFIRIGDLEFVTDLSSAEWVTNRIHGFGLDFGSIIPEGFAAYARVFHPARRRIGQPSQDLGYRSVRWSDIAAVNGTVMHPDAQFEAISGADPWRDLRPGVWDTAPQIGELPGDVTTRLVDILGHQTSTPQRCWFCVWEGWGGLRSPTQDRVRLPQRNYLLVAAPISAALGAFESIGARGPSLWWPDDRAWVVATEIDFRWTYVGGSTDCIDAVLFDRQLEALPVKPDHRFTIDSDQVNPLPQEIIDRYLKR
jgi:hypothetical protein